jgi:hypothetical protein
MTQPTDAKAIHALNGARVKGEFKMNEYSRKTAIV